MALLVNSLSMEMNSSDDASFWGDAVWEIVYALDEVQPIPTQTATHSIENLVSRLIPGVVDMLEGLKTIDESETNQFCRRLLTSMLREIVHNYAEIIHSSKRTSIEEETVRPPLLRFHYN